MKLQNFEKNTTETYLMFAFLQPDNNFSTRCRMLSGSLVSVLGLQEAHSYVSQLVDECCMEICVVQLRTLHNKPQAFSLGLYPTCNFGKSNNTSRDVPTHPRWVGHNFHAPLFQPGILLLRMSEPKGHQL